MWNDIYDHMCWFAAQERFLIINIETSYAYSFFFVETIIFYHSKIQYIFFVFIEILSFNRDKLNWTKSDRITGKCCKNANKVSPPPWNSSIYAFLIFNTLHIFSNVSLYVGGRQRRSWSADVLHCLAPTLKKTSPACSPSNSEDLD